MAHEAKVTIAGKDVRILDFTYTLNRDVDANGSPSSRVYGGKITMTIEGTDDNSLFEWMVDGFSTKDGAITIMKRESNTKMKEIKWEKGYVILHTESFDSKGTEPLTLTFTVSAEKIKIGSATHTNPWTKS